MGTFGAISMGAFGAMSMRGGLRCLDLDRRLRIGRSRLNRLGRRLHFDRLRLQPRRAEAWTASSIFSPQSSQALQPLSTIWLREASVTLTSV